MEINKISVCKIQNGASQEIQKVHIHQGQALHVESGAMLACHNVDIETRNNGSIKEILKRFFIGQESVFQNTYTAKNGSGWIAFEEGVRGQIKEYVLHPGEILILAPETYTASDSNVALTTHFAGVKELFSGVGLTKLMATLKTGKSGRVFFNSPQGVIKTIHLTKEMGPMIVDNDCLLGYTSGLTSTIRKMGGYTSLLFSGEGSVAEFQGNGVIFVGSSIETEKNNLLTIFLDNIYPGFWTTAYRVGIIATALFIGFSPQLGVLSDTLENWANSIKPNIVHVSSIHEYFATPKHSI